MSLELSKDKEDRQKGDGYTVRSRFSSKSKQVLC